MRPRIILAVGLPGSGKSTYLAGIGAHPISTDALRLQLADDETDQTINDRVYGAVRHLLRARIALRRPVTYIDATNLTRRDRRSFIKMARANDCAVEALYFDVPPEICKQRNAERGRVVPDHAMELMAAKFVPPSTDEGFDAVEIVRPATETRYRDAWPADDPHSNFKAEVACYTAADPMPTIRNLSAATGIPINSLIRYVLVKYAASGSDALLAMDPIVFRQMREHVRGAEENGSAEAKLRAYDALREMISWLGRT